MGQYSPHLQHTLLLLKILAYGGSARPAQILEEAGIDMTDPEFWQGGFDVIRAMIDELEAIELE